MKDKISLIISIVIAIILSVGILYGVYTLGQTTAKTDAIITFINTKVQQSQSPVVPAK